jgi:phage regulator Rha-like protein
VPNEISNQTPTMSSREIAELVDSSHDSVLKTVRALVARGVVSGNETPYRHPQNGQSYPEFLLTFRDTMVVVSGYSAELRARIIDRWQELEKVVAPLAPMHALPQSFAQALQLAADQARQIEQQNATIAEQAPKVDLYERLLNAGGLIGLQDAGRALHCHPNLFIRDVVIPDYCFRDGSRIVAKQSWVQRGLFENKAFTAPNDKVLLRAWMTPKGLAHFGTVRIPDHVKNPPRASATKSVPAISAAATAY